MENYTIEAVLGKGSYGKIYKAKRKSDGLICVLKLIGLEGLDEDERNDTLNEVNNYIPVITSLLFVFHFIYYSPCCVYSLFLLVQSYATNRSPKYCKIL